MNRQLSGGSKRHEAANAVPDDKAGAGGIEDSIEVLDLRLQSVVFWSRGALTAAPAVVHVHRKRRSQSSCESAVHGGIGTAPLHYHHSGASADAHHLQRRAIDMARDPCARLFHSFNLE